MTVPLDRSGYKLARDNLTDGYTRFTVSVADSTLQKLKKLAKADGCSVSAQAREALDLWAACASPRSWENQPASEQQIEQLKSYGFKPQELKGMKKGAAGKHLYKAMGKAQYVKSSEEANRMQHLTKSEYYDNTPDSTIIDTELENEALKRNGIITDNTE